MSNVTEIIAYEQSSWLSQFIEYNAEKRLEAIEQKNDFGKSFYKLISNSTYGRFIMNTEKFSGCRAYLNDAPGYQRALGSAYYRHDTILNETSAIVFKRKQRVMLSQPKIIGAVILQRSKMLMQNLFYDTIQPRLVTKLPGTDLPDYRSVNLMFTDTDSLHITSRVDPWAMVAECKDVFDCSDISRDSIHASMIDKSNSGVYGKFKIEHKGYEIVKFVGLRPKQYAVLDVSGLANADKKCKGVSRSTVKNMRFEEFEDCWLHTQRLLNGEKYDRDQIMTVAVCGAIASDHLQSYTVTRRKKALCCSDNKRYMLPDGSTLAYGHCSLRALPDANPQAFEPVDLILRPAQLNLRTVTPDIIARCAHLTEQRSKKLERKEKLQAKKAEHDATVTAGWIKANEEAEANSAATKEARVKVMAEVQAKFAAIVQTSTPTEEDSPDDFDDLSTIAEVTEEDETADLAAEEEAELGELK